MFVKLKGTDGGLHMININLIDSVFDNNSKSIAIETSSRIIRANGNLESFAKTLADIMKTKQIMWYKPQ